jgi:putative ABC transport system permease protein
VGLGIGGAVLLAESTEFTTIVEAPSVLLALSFSGFIGVFFGFYPARRAAVLDPVEALRYE